MTDGEENVLGQTVVNDTYPLGMPINVGDTYAFMPSGLPTIPSINTPLMITGEHENDYIQFTLGSLSWTSRTTAGVATCSNGGWDPKDGPVCGLRYGDQNAVCSRAPICPSISFCPELMHSPPKEKSDRVPRSVFGLLVSCSKVSRVRSTAFERAIRGFNLVQLRRSVCTSN